MWCFDLPDVRRMAMGAMAMSGSSPAVTALLARIGVALLFLVETSTSSRSLISRSFAAADSSAMI